MQKNKDLIPDRFEYSCARPEDHHLAILAAVEQFAVERAIEQPLRYRLGVIIDELITNSILHGGCIGEQQRLAVSICDQETQILVTLVDSGKPFDPTAHILTSYPEAGAQVPIGGVGLCLVRRLSDSLKYTRNKDHNELLLALHKPRPEEVCS